LRWKWLGKKLPYADVNVATFCFTTFAVVGLPRPFYYVQHYEPLFFKDRYLRHLAWSTYKLPLKQIVVSRWLQKLLRERFGREATYVGNGIDLSVFRRRSRRWFGDRSKRVVCAFFRGIEWKGDTELIEAVHRVNKKRKDILLTLVGPHDRLSEGLRQYSDLIDYPVMTLSSLSDDELAQIYSSADVFVSASWYEGFGLPSLEAMACGSPVVMTDSLGSRDYAVHLKNAYVVPPRDPRALAEAIDRVLSDETLRAGLIKRGLETAREFDFEKVGPRVEAALIQSLRNHK
jgi:glycosyltransferase involved in cell wall biosynthesis